MRSTMQALEEAISSFQDIVDRDGSDAVFPAPEIRNVFMALRDLLADEQQIDRALFDLMSRGEVEVQMFGGVPKFRLTERGLANREYGGGDA